MHNLKSIFALLFVTATFLAAAQPQKVNYQAVALTAGGQTVKNQAIKLRLSIVDSSATGTVLYTETHQPTTDGAGQFSVFLGGGTSTLGTFSSVPWSNGKDKFLKAEADVTGGTNYLLMGTSQIVSVPYAISAGSLIDSSKVTAQDGTQWSLIVGPNGPSWQQTSGPGGVNMNYPCPGVPTVTYGGQTYNTVQIGTQCWFKENLNIGTIIYSTTGISNQTNNGIIEKYCYNNDTTFCTIYGGLYQWAEAVQYKNGASNTTSANLSFNSNIQGICPAGWHLPNDMEWCALTTFLDATVNCGATGVSGTDVGGKMKSISNLWLSPNSGGTNNSGFSAIPLSNRSNNGSFGFNGFATYFWASSEISMGGAIIRSLAYNNSQLGRLYYDKANGFSVRCLKD